MLARLVLLLAIAAKRRAWSGGAPAAFLASLAEGGRPVVVTGAPWVAAGGAFDPQLWTPHALARRAADREVQIKRSKSPIFGLGCCQLRNASVSALLDESAALSAQRPERGHVYFAGPLGEVAKSDVALGAAIAAMRVREVAGGESKAVVWIGSRGAVTPCHYDEMHNVFVQLHGAKRFTLWPPSAWRHLYLAPKYDAQHRNIDRAVHADMRARRGAARFDRFPSLRFARRAARTVELAPGEMLYLPPLWFHEVEALGATTISANVWSAARSVARMRAAWESALPLRPDAWPIEATVAVAARLVRAVVARALGGGGGGGGDALGFLSALVETRYAHRAPPGGEAAAQAESLDAHAANHARYLARVAREAPSFLAQARRRTGGVGGAAQLKRWCRAPTAQQDALDGLEPGALRDAAIMIGAQLQPAPLRHRRSGVDATAEEAAAVAAQSDTDAQLGAAEIFVANFIEDVAGQVVGYAHVGRFMEDCVLGRADGEEASELAGAPQQHY